MTAPAPSEIDPVGQAPFQITDETSLATAGSCFSQHLARYLATSGYNYMVSEPAPEAFDPGTAQAFNYGTFTARYGNMYSPRQFLHTIERAFGERSPAEDVWRDDDGSWIDPHRPAIQPGGFSSETAFFADRDMHFAAVRDMVVDHDVLIFTLGLTEIWRSRLDGTVFPLCPGTAGGQFDPDLHEFVNLGVNEVVDDLRALLDAIRIRNPHQRTILTVSPVPLVATASGKHVLTATTYSKSVLRVAAEMLSQEEPDVAYFPSYEVIMSPAIRGQYFASDLRNVREVGVSHVMRLFFEHYCDGDTPISSPTRERGPREAMLGGSSDMSVKDALDVICDLELLDP